MRTDKITKALLAIIAVNLSILTINDLDLFPKAYARELPSINSKLVDYKLVPVNGDGTINVTVQSIKMTDPIEINLKEIGGIAVFGEIPVRSGANPVEVRVAR